MFHLLGCRSPKGLASDVQNIWDYYNRFICLRYDGCRFAAFTGVHCGKVPHIDHGYVENTTSLLSGGLITYKCFEGFTLSSDATTRCLDPGQWDNLPTCVGEYRVRFECL